MRYEIDEATGLGSKVLRPRGAGRVRGHHRELLHLPRNSLRVALAVPRAAPRAAIALALG